MEGRFRNSGDELRGHQELPWYLRGIKDPPIAPFLMSSSPTLPFIALALITPDYAFQVRARSHEIKSAFDIRMAIFIDGK